MPRLIFLDAEFTGLDPFRDQITEIGWIVRNQDGFNREQEFIVQHDKIPSEWVLKRTDYLTRILPAKKTPISTVLSVLWEDSHERYKKEEKIVTYLVGANPRQDHEFLQQAFLERSPGFFPAYPWHFRFIDVETMGHAILGQFQEPPSLARLRTACGIKEEHKLKHTALSDAREAMKVYDYLMAVKAKKNQSTSEVLA